MICELKFRLWVLLLVTLLTRVATGYNCVRLRHAPGSCYIFKSNPLTWREAVQDCVTHHSGHLVAIESDGELKAITSHLKNKHGGMAYYVGAISVDGHQSWFWYNSGALLRLPSNKWEDAQPDNEAEGGENCLSLDFRGAGSSRGEGGLADVACWARNPYICEVLTPDYADYYGGFRLDERSNDWPWG